MASLEARNSPQKQPAIQPPTSAMTQEALKSGTTEVSNILRKGLVPTPQELEAKHSAERYKEILALQDTRRQQFGQIMDWLQKTSRGEKAPITSELSRVMLGGKAAEFPADLQAQVPLLQKNFNKLRNDPKLVEAFVSGGLNLQDESGGKVKVLPMDQVGAGGLGSIHKAAVAFENNKLVDVVMKQPLQSEGIAELQKIAYVREVEVARLLKSVDGERNKPGGENVIRPLVISKPQNGNELPTICYDLITDADGKGRNFEDAVEQKSFSKVVDGFGEVCKGLNWLHERGMIHGDIKSENMMLSADGKHKLIDIGSVIPKSEIESGKLQFGDVYIGIKEVVQPDGTKKPEYETIRAAMRGETMYGTTPYYNQHDVLEKLVTEKKPVEAVDKKALGITIRESLSKMGFLSIKDFEGIDQKQPYAITRVKTKVEADSYDVPLRQKYLENSLPFPPEHVEMVYEVARKLMSAPDHPYEFIDNDPKKGKDPNYISLTEAASILKTAAVDFK